MQDVKDSRLKLLILQILANLKNERRVRQVISEFNTHSASYEEWEENIILRIKAKVDQEEKEALRAEKEAAEEARIIAEKARIIAEETIEKLQTSVKEEEEAFLDHNQHTQSPRLRKPRWVQQLLKKVNPVNWPTPVSLTLFPFIILDQMQQNILWIRRNKICFGFNWHKTSLPTKCKKIHFPKRCNKSLIRLRCNQIQL